MNPQTQKTLIMSGVLAIVVTILVMVNTPTPQDIARERNKGLQFFKILIVSFVICSIVVYIMSDNDQNSMMTNIIKGEPDF